MKKSEDNIRKYSEDIFATKKLVTVDQILDEQDKYMPMTMLTDLKKINRDILNL